MKENYYNCFMKKIICLGGGITSLIAAITLKRRHKDYLITVIEKDNECLKRIKISGNGRCNFTNEHISSIHYSNGEKIEHILSFFYKAKEEFYKSIGLLYYYDDEGRGYPLSDSSRSVWTLIMDEAMCLGINIAYDEIRHIEYHQNIILKGNSNYQADYLILGLGGQSYLYKRENYALLDELKIPVKEAQSSLCPIIVEEKIPAYLVGKRVKCVVSLLKNNQIAYQEQGEVLFKKDGLSGICIFNISAKINRLGKAKYIISLDLTSGLTYEDISSREKDYGKEKCLTSLVNEEVKTYILSLNKDLYSSLKRLNFTYKSNYPLKESQVTNGGIPLEEIDLDNLTLKKYPKIYAGGELIDVDGDCGGFNIFFAFASGYFIGNKID